MYEIDIYLSTVSLSYEALNKTIVITGCWVFEFSILNSLLFESLCFVPLPSVSLSRQMNARWWSYWHCAITLYIVTPSGTDFKLHSVVQEIFFLQVYSKGYMRECHISSTTQENTALSGSLHFVRCSGFKGGLCMTERESETATQTHENLPLFGCKNTT